MDEEQKPQTINEEAGLPDNWVPVDAPPIIPGSSLADGSSRVLQGSLPPQSQHDASFVGTAYKSDRTPSVALMPLGVQGNPASNAAVQSTSGQVAARVVASSTAGIQSVAFTAPKEAVITGSPVVPPGGTIAWAWASEPPGFVFQSPPPGLTGYQGSATGFVHNGVGQSAQLTLSNTPTSSNSLALLAVNPTSNPATPSGWTAVAGNNFWFQAITGTSPVSVTFPNQGQQTTITGSLSLFNGPAPSLVQSRASNTSSGTLAFSSNNTAGNTIVVAIIAQGFSPANSISIVMADTNGNLYNRIVNQPFLGATSVPVEYQTSIWVATNIVGGANSISWTITSGSGSLGGLVINIMEFGPLPSGNAIPFFAPISESLIPPINLALSGNGGIGGTLGVPNGGTGKGTLTAHGLLVGEGTAAVAVTGAGTAGQVMASNGPSADPTFQGALVQVATTSLSSAQILALQTTPITLVAAPGVQLTIIPISISIIFFGGTIAYTDAGGAVSFNIGSATQALASNNIFLTAASPNKQIQRVAGFAATDTSGNPPTDENAAMTISKATNNFAAGNGTAKIVVHYIVMPTV